MDTTGINKACELIGGTKALAVLIGVTFQTVYQWREGGRWVPLERCVDIEKATNGDVTCEELRPDKSDYWAYLRGLTEKAA